MQLDILTPEKTLFSGEVDSVTLPGTLGMFTVLENHAPLISSLSADGVVSYTEGGESGSFDIDGGFVEVLANRVTACVEVRPESAGGKGKEEAGNEE